MALTMAELSGASGMSGIRRVASGWAEIDAPGGTRWVPLHQARRMFRSSAETPSADVQRRSGERATGHAWWGEDPYKPKGGVGQNAPFDPRLGRNVRNIREWQDLQRAKERSGVPPGVHSKEDWVRARAERRAARKSAGQKARDAAKARQDARRQLAKDRAAARKKRAKDIKEGRYKPKPSADKKKWMDLLKQHQAASGPVPSSWTTPRVASTRYRSPARTAGPSISSGGTTITKRVKIADYAVLARPTTGGGRTYGTPAGDPLLALQRKTRAAFDARVRSGGPLATSATAYSVGTSGLGSLASSEHAVLSGLSGGLSGLG